MESMCWSTAVPVAPNNVWLAAVPTFDNSVWKRDQELAPFILRHVALSRMHFMLAVQTAVSLNSSTARESNVEVVEAVNQTLQSSGLYQELRQSASQLRILSAAITTMEQLATELRGSTRQVRADDTGEPNEKWADAIAKYAGST